MHAVANISKLLCVLFLKNLIGKDETQVSMNTSPVYDTVRTNAGTWYCVNHVVQCVVLASQN